MLEAFFLRSVHSPPESLCKPLRVFFVFEFALFLFFPSPGIESQRRLNRTEESDSDSDSSNAVNCFYLYFTFMNIYLDSYCSSREDILELWKIEQWSWMQRTAHISHKRRKKRGRKGTSYSVRKFQILLNNILYAVSIFILFLIGFMPVNKTQQQQI